MITVGTLWQQMFGQPMYPNPKGSLLTSGNETDLTQLRIGTDLGIDCEAKMRLYYNVWRSVDPHPLVREPLLASLRSLLEIFYYG